MAHGDEAAAQAAETARKTFEEGAAADTLPTVDVPAADLAAGIPAFALFARVGLAASNGEARRLIKGGGAKVNDQTIAEETQAIGSDHAKDGVIKLTAGKKRHLLVRVAS